MSWRKTHKQTLRQKRLALRAWMVSTSCRVSLLGVIAVFGVMYLMQMSSVSTKGFTMSELQSTIQTLQHETRALDVEIAESRSLSSVQERLAGMNMVVSDSVEYVTPVGTAVARR